MNGVKKCGPDVTSGLSIIDVDNINALYNCQEFRRHRWRPIENLTREDISNMHSFGFRDSTGEIFPCRGLRNGEIIVGKYSWNNRICLLSLDGQVYYYINGFEVLTIPGGLNIPGATYNLVDPETVGSAKVINMAVQAGRKAERENYQTGYIAYIPGFVAGAGQENTIGTVWVRDGVLAEALYANANQGEEYYMGKGYFVLTCG